MLDFVFEFLPKLFVPLAVVFAAASWIWPGIPRLCRRKVRRCIALMMPNSPHIRKVLSASVTILILGFVSLYGIHVWRSVYGSKSPSLVQLCADTSGLADSIDAQMQDGGSPDELMQSFAGDLNALIPRFKQAGRWGKELRQTYKPDNVYDLMTWTNLVKSLRSTANNINESM